MKPSPEFVHRRLALSPEHVLWLVGLGTALSLLGDTTLYVILPTHTAQAGVLLADVGLMLSANRAIRIFLNSPYGVLIERLPRRRVLVSSLFLGALSTLLYIVPGFWPLLIGRLLWGIAWAGIWLGGSTVILDISNSTNRGRFVGRYQMWGFIGLGAGALLGGLLTDSIGYQAVFVIFTIIPLLTALAWWWLLPETRRPHEPSAASGQPAVLANGVIIGRAPLLTAVVVMGLNWLIFMGVIGALLSLLLQQRAVGLLIPVATLTGIVSAGSQVVSLLSAPLSGWLSDRTGNRWLLVIGALVLGIIALLMAAFGAGILVILGILLGAVTTSVLQTQAVTLAGDYAGVNHRGRILGLLNTVGDLGSAAGPFLAFRLLPALNLSGLLALSALLLALLFPWVCWIGWQELRLARHVVVS